MDAAHTWTSGPIRDPAEMAKSDVPRQPQDIRRPVEKSPQDTCVGSVPFDYSILEDSGCAPDAGSDAPKEDLKEVVPDADNAADINQEPPPVEAGVQDQGINKINAENKLTPILTENATPIIGCKGLLNRKEVRLTALRLINERFPSEKGRLFSRVSDKFIDRLELAVQTEMLAAINRHPSPVVSPTVNQTPWTQKTTPNSNTPPTVPPP